MKKFGILILAVVLVLGAVLIGCSKKNTTTPAEEPTATPTTATQATDTPTISGTPTYTPTPGGQTGMLEDAEDGNNANNWGGYWYTYNDAGDSGTSWGVILPQGTTNFTDTNTMDTPGANSTSYAIHVSGATGATPSYAYFGIGTQLNANGGCPNCTGTDISSYTGIRLYVKGTISGATLYCIIPYEGTCGGSVCTNLAGYNDYKAPITVSSTWTQVTLPFSSFTVENGWGTPASSINNVLPDVKQIQFQVKGPNATFDIWLDEIEFY